MLPLIIVGFGMMTLGFALLCLGEVPLVQGKRLPALRSRIIGGILFSYLPLALASRYVADMLLDADSAGGTIVAWGLLIVFLFGIGAILFRILVPKRESRRPAPKASAPAGRNPFGADEAAALDVREETPDEAPPRSQPEPAHKKPSSARTKSRKPAAEGDNPFDFS